MYKKAIVSGVMNLLGMRPSDIGYQEARSFFDSLTGVERKSRAHAVAALFVEIGKLQESLQKAVAEKDSAEKRVTMAVVRLVQHRLDFAIQGMHKEANPIDMGRFAAWCEELRDAIREENWRVAVLQSDLEFEPEASN